MASRKMNVRAFLLIVLFPLSVGAAAQLVDKESTPETMALFEVLQKQSGKGMLFGHQDSTLYGVGWKAAPGETDKSDIHLITGAYPSVYGWDVGRFPSGDLLYGSEDLYRQHIIAAHARGGVNTFSWHMFNPVTGENFYDLTPAVPAILPGGDKHGAYKNTLDQLANFILSLKDTSDRPIPIIFRPFHEHTGSWFWWGKRFCTQEEYIALWRFTVEYLRDEKGVHQLLYAYSPDKVGSAKAYFERYPGDDYVDILGLDNYIRGENPKEIDAMLTRLRMVVEEAEKRSKIAALTETGLEGVVDSDWFTRVIMKPIKNDAIAQRIAYMLVWRNQDERHHFAPYPKHKSEHDFIAFYQDPFVVFGPQTITQE